MQTEVNHSLIARELFMQGCNCSQAVFAAFCDLTGLERDFALRISSSFGGGMGRLREVCGAFSGILMVAGCLYGYSDVSEPSLKNQQDLRREQARLSAVSIWGLRVLPHPILRCAQRSFTKPAPAAT
jgi:hypothetical protein